MRQPEIARTGSQFAERRNEFAVAVELGNSRHCIGRRVWRLAAVALSDEYIAVRCDDDTGRFRERVRRISSDPRFAEREQDFSFRAEFDDRMALVYIAGIFTALPLIHAAGVGDP